jgi:putative tricarboxylic transport membrane protein
VLYPLIITLSLLGSYTIRNSLMDCWICLFAGALGWLCKREGVPPAPIVLGLVLGGMLEVNFRRALMMNGYSTFFESPGALLMLLLSGVFLLWPVLDRKRQKLKQV